MSENRNDPLRSLRNIIKENNEMKYLLLNCKMTVWMICPVPLLCIFSILRDMFDGFLSLGVVLGGGGLRVGLDWIVCLLYFLWGGVGVGGVCSRDLELTRKGVCFFFFLGQQLLKHALKLKLVQRFHPFKSY